MDNASSISFIRCSPREIYLWSGALALLAVLWSLLLREQYHLLVALVIMTSLFAVSRVNKATAAIMTIAYLFVMGDVRRVVALVAPQPVFDPLLLISPIMAATLAAPALFALRLRDNLSKAMLALLIVMVIEIFNPAQGSLAVGLSGAFFYIVPVLWFWVGRRLASPTVVERLLYKQVVPLAIAAAVLGLCQTFIGFLPYQQAWINLASKVYTSLSLGSSIRPFGFSVSASEYATLLVFGALIVVSAALCANRIWLIAFPLLGTALVLASGRGVVMKFVVTLSFVWIMRKGEKLKPSTIIGMALGGVLSLVALSFVASSFAPEEPKPGRGTAAQDALSHQLGGLGHPFDSRYSTAGTHSDMVMAAFSAGFSHPLGLGLGATTFAAEKLGSNPSQGSSEVDLSDMFSAIGLVGGTTYLLAAILVLQSVFRYVQIAPRRVSLPVFSIVIVTFGGWLVGGQYSTSALLFFLIGALVQQVNQAPTEALRRRSISAIG